MIEKLNLFLDEEEKCYLCRKQKLCVRFHVEIDSDEDEDEDVNISEVVFYLCFNCFEAKYEDLVKEMKLLEKITQLEAMLMNANNRILFLENNNRKLHVHNITIYKPISEEKVPENWDNGSWGK